MKNTYTEIDGIKCYAPALAMESDGFDKRDFELLNKAEERSFWFRIRNKIIRHLVSKYAGLTDRLKFLEIGCGNGFVLKGLSQLKNLELTGSEIYVEGLKYARKRLPDVELIQLDATNIPFENRYDIIGAFDVLEHITPDEQVMKMVYRALTDKGIFLITVPQYPWMWSAQDEYAFHKRRYTRKELVSKLEQNGFKIKYVGSFVFTLFPMMAMSRFLKKEKKHDVMSEFNIPDVLNSFFYLLMHIDYTLIRLGISLPWGGSLVALAKRK